jgi:hypothetical protein
MIYFTGLIFKDFLFSWDQNWLQYPTVIADWFDWYRF